MPARDPHMRHVPFNTLAVVALLWSCVGGCQSKHYADFDPAAAQQHFRDDSTLRFSKPLYEFEPGRDGVRGFGIPNPQALRAAITIAPPFATKIEWETYYDYCAWDAIVLATNLDSTAVLSSDKRLIYTVSHFSVLDSIKSDVALRRGEGLVVYRLGGMVEDGGEKLRIDTADMAAFEPQKAYILQLKRDKSASVRQYSLPLGQTITATNDKVYPIPGKYAWLVGVEEFPSGADYADIRNTFVRVSKLKTCR